MAEYIFLMHDDAVADEKAWEPYLRGCGRADSSRRQRHRRWRLRPEERRAGLGDGASEPASSG